MFDSPSRDSTRRHVLIAVSHRLAERLDLVCVCVCVCVCVREGVCVHVRACVLVLWPDAKYSAPWTAAGSSSALSCPHNEGPLTVITELRI